GSTRFRHQSNLECYIKSFNREVTLTFTGHAATFTVCLDITRDVMGMRAAGTPLVEVRQTIDGKYHVMPTPTPYPKGRRGSHRPRLVRLAARGEAGRGARVAGSGRP